MLGDVTVIASGIPGQRLDADAGSQTGGCVPAGMEISDLSSASGGGGIGNLSGWTDLAESSDAGGGRRICPAFSSASGQRKVRCWLFRTGSYGKIS